MAKRIVNRIDRNLARRLREARQEVGLSTRAVSEILPRRRMVSHSTIAAYEKGEAVPAIDVLAALAEVYGRTLNWFLEDRRNKLTGFQFRNLKSRVGVKDRRQFEAIAGKWLDGYFGLERHLRCPLRPRFSGIEESADIPPIALAKILRAEFGLDESDPIHSVIKLLEESCGVRVLELRTTLPMEGAAAVHGDHPVVVVNPETPSVRLRMNAACELARVLYVGCKNEHQLENLSYDFASALLLPDIVLEQAMEGKSFLKLIDYKERFGVSLSAMVYRAEKLKLIRTTTARWLSVEMTKRGWRENEPGHVYRDRAVRFETMLESAVQTKSLTWSDAESVTGIREHDLRRRLEEVTRPIESSLHEKEEEGDSSATILDFPK